jgi:stage V sporulation protein S
MATHDPPAPGTTAPAAAAGAPPPALPAREPADLPLGRAVEALRVSTSSRPTAVAGAIAGMVRERGRAEVQAIGAGALNQAVKAVAIARGYLAPAGIDLVCVPGFVDVRVNAEERTAIRLIVEPR